MDGDRRDARQYKAICNIARHPPTRAPATFAPRTARLNGTPRCARLLTHAAPARASLTAETVLKSNCICAPIDAQLLLCSIANTRPPSGCGCVALRFRCGCGFVAVAVSLRLPCGCVAAVEAFARACARLQACTKRSGGLFAGAREQPGRFCAVAAGRFGAGAAWSPVCGCGLLPVRRCGLVADARVWPRACFAFGFNLRCSPRK